MKKIKLLIVFFLLVTFSMFSQNKKYEPYTVLEGETLLSVSQKFSITPYNLIKLNPELNQNDLLERGMVLIVPNKNYNPTKAAIDSGKDYVENGFLIHKVVPQENFYRLKKEFGVSKRLLRKYNPILRVEDLKAGQVIKFPVPRNYKQEDTQAQVAMTTKPYMVKPKETKYGISRRYGITIEKLEELNPQIKEKGIKMTDIILVPDTAEIPDPIDDFSFHRIEKDETFFSLSQQFEMTKEELIAVNPELSEGVKEGMLIKISTLMKASTADFVPAIIPDKEIKAILMLPFMSHKPKVDFSKNRMANVAIDFYLGSMMALDSVKKQGLSVDMKVFDTQNSKTKLSSLLASGNLSNADVMIGPLFFGNVQFVSSILKNKQIAIVSPISQKDHAPMFNDKLIQSVASEEKMIDAVLNHIKNKYKGENLLIVTDTLKVSIPKVTKILKALQSLDSLNTITVLKPKKGYIKRELFLEKIVEKKDNFIILVSNDGIVTTDVVQNLGALPKKTNATLFGFNKGSNVSNNDLAHVNFHYTVSTYVDKENADVQQFIKKYKQKNYSEPSEYAFRGFDVTYDILLRLATHQDVTKALNAGYSSRAATKFQYSNNGASKGFTNTGVHLMKYDGLNIVKVQEEIIVSEE